MAGPLEDRLLSWTQVGRLYLTHTQAAVGIVFEQNSTRFCWLILVAGIVKFQAEAASLHSALAHIEGNFVGRRLLDSDPNSDSESEMSSA